MNLKLVAICALAVTSLTSTAYSASLFADNFDNDKVGAFPSNWTLRYNGAGTRYQAVGNKYSVSKPNSLNLVGSSCWAAQAYHPITFPKQTKGIDSHVQMAVAVFVGNLSSGGCSAINARVALWNPGVGTWGTPYAGVNFQNDGYIYSVAGEKLIAFATNTWITVSLDVDMTANQAEITINGILVASGLKLPTTVAPTGIELTAGHGSGNPSVWFDNVYVGTPVVSK